MHATALGNELQSCSVSEPLRLVPKDIGSGVTHHFAPSAKHST
jgi:hypothetical protein